MAATACSTVYTGEQSKANLEKKDYEVTLMTEAEAKLLIVGINFEDVTLKSAVHATKGEGDNHDIFLGFYFDSDAEAEKFATKNKSENLALLGDYGDSQIGGNLTKKLGYHNNVSYVSSETSFEIAL